MANVINENMLALLKGDKGDGLDEIVDGTLTAKKAEQDANGNNIADTYAKLSQVVRIDAKQSITVAQAQQALENVGQNTSNDSVALQVLATYAFYTSYSTYVKLGTFYIGDSNIEIDINAGLGAANTSGKIILLSLNGDIQCAEGRWDQKSDNITFWYDSRDKKGNYSYVDIYCNNVQYGKMYCTVRATGIRLIEKAINVSSLPATKVVLNNSFRFIADPSKLVPSTANGWTQGTSSSRPSSAGVYLVKADSNPVTLIAYYSGAAWASGTTIWYKKV